MDTQIISIADLASDYQVSRDDINTTLGLRHFAHEIEVTKAQLEEIHEKLAAKFS